jgi:hypothetical protein
LFSGRPDTQHITQALHAFGLQAPNIEPDAQDIWPENMQAFNVFVRMMRQWIIGHAGPIGLRLEALPVALRLEAVPRADWTRVANGVAVIEAETLRLLANQKR